MTGGYRSYELKLPLSLIGLSPGDMTKMAVYVNDFGTSTSKFAYNYAAGLSGGATWTDTATWFEVTTHPCVRPVGGELAPVDEATLLSSVGELAVLSSAAVLALVLRRRS